MNQFNPVVMAMNSYMNVELAAASGKDRGYMWEAQAISMMKQPLAIIGSGLMAAAPILLATGVGAPLAGLAYIGGLTISAVANSIQVNPTTGERLTRFDDRAAVQTGLAATTSVLPGAAGAVVSTAANAASQGIQYNDRGSISGYSLAGEAGEAALVTGLVGAATSVAGYYGSTKPGVNAAGESVRVSRFDTNTFNGKFSNGVFNQAISTPFNTLGEYYKLKNLGAEYSNYNSLARPDLGTLGSLAGIGLSAAITTNLTEYGAEKAARDARDQGNHAQAAQILAGAGYNADRRRRLLESWNKEYENVGEGEAPPVYVLETAMGDVGSSAQTMGNPELDKPTMGQNAATDLILAWMQEAGLIDAKTEDNYHIVGTMTYKIAQRNGGLVSMADVMEVVADANGGELPNVSSERLTASINDSRTYYAGVLNNRARPATSVAGLIMEYSGMNPVMARGAVASNYRFAGEMHNVRVAAAQMKAAQQQQQVATHASAIRMGRGNPSQFNNQFYEYLTGNQMSSVPVSYTTAESVNAWTIGANQYIMDRLVVPSATLAFGGPIALGTYMNAKVFGGFSPYDAIGHRDAHMANMRSGQRAETIAFANQFESTAVMAGEMIALGGASRVLQRAGVTAAESAYGYVGRWHGLANGAFNSGQSVLVEQLVRKDTPLFSRQTAITASGGFVTGALTHRSNVPATVVINASGNFLAQLANQQFIDPTRRISGTQLLATTAVASANSYTRGKLETRIMDPINGFPENGINQAFGTSLGVSNAFWLGGTFAVGLWGD